VSIYLKYKVYVYSHFEENLKQKKIFTLAEAANRMQIDKNVLAEWIEGKVVVPSVMTDRSEPCFDEGDLEQLAQILHLWEMGYSLLEMKKIAKKIGLPRPDKQKRKLRKVRHYLTVGELAERSDLNARTIKYWEERGIIEPTTRSEGGHRLYDENYVLFCSLIHDLQLFGYSLEEIKGAADLFRLYYEIHTGAYSGSEKQKLEGLGEMIEKIEGLFKRTDELTKEIERWKKLLKEKQTEIQAMIKRLSKKRDKGAAAAKAKSPS